MCSTTDEMNMDRSVPVGEDRDLSAGFLKYVKTKSFRNGNWWHLSHLERAFYRSTIALASLRGFVSNRKLVEALKELIGRLLATPSDRIMRAGCARAEQLLRHLTETGMTTWVSLVTRNLSNSDFIFCLGLDCLNARNAGVTI